MVFYKTKNIPRVDAMLSTIRGYEGLWYISIYKTATFCPFYFFAI